MSEDFKLKYSDIIGMLTYLETKVGDKTSYKILNPSDLNTSDIIDLQSTAKKMAEFIGITNYVFIVSYGELKKNVGGIIELKWGEKEVFIEISNEFKHSRNSLLSVIAHELSHKYIQIHNLEGKTPTNNIISEHFTDITAVYLGFGKIMLNGKHNKIKSYEGFEEKETIYQSGYVDIDRLGFIYKIICQMRGISDKDMKTSLTEIAKKSLPKDKKIKKFFKIEHNDKEYRALRKKSIDRELYEYERLIAETKANIDSIKKTYLENLEADINNNYKELHNTKQQINNYTSTKYYDPVLDILKNIEFDNFIDLQKEKIANSVFLLKKNKKKTDSILSRLKKKNRRWIK